MIDYVFRSVPEILKENDTMKNLYGVEKEEIKKLNDEIIRVINNSFISSADIDGVIKYEELRNIKPNVDYSLEIRKANVLNKMLFKPPFTRQRLDSILKSIYGEGNYYFEIIANEFRVIIDIDTSIPEIYLQFSKDIRNIVPANMYLIFSIQYAYFYLNRNFTYNKLSELTYSELSQYSEINLSEGEKNAVLRKL